jgi:hypothetical protein
MNIYSLWFAIPGAFLIVLIPMLPFLIFEITRKRQQKVQREVAKREWEIKYRARHIEQLERENEDFEGWLVGLHELVDSCQEMQEFWELLKISPLSTSRVLQQIWEEQNRSRQRKAPTRDYYVPNARDFTY